MAAKIALSQSTLVEQLGSPYTPKVVERFNQFAVVPSHSLDALAQAALAENWGNRKFVLRKYLAVQVPWSIEQGAVTFGEDQWYVTAGHLQTRYGTPIYLAFEKNARADIACPWWLRYAGSDISAPELPNPPEIPTPPEILPGAEIVMMHDHILGDNSERIVFLRNTPIVAQMCAVAGAIQWSLNRKLQMPVWYFGKMSYLVPLYLKDREDITKAPDAIAPVQINKDHLVVRTVLEPHMPFAGARVSVRRHDQLPRWMLAAWERHADQLSDDEVDDLGSGFVEIVERERSA